MHIDCFLYIIKAEWNINKATFNDATTMRIFRKLLIIWSDSLKKCECLKVKNGAKTVD